MERIADGERVTLYHRGYTVLGYAPRVAGLRQYYVQAGEGWKDFVAAAALEAANPNARRVPVEETGR